MPRLPDTHCCCCTRVTAQLGTLLPKEGPEQSPGPRTSICVCVSSPSAAAHRKHCATLPDLINGIELPADQFIPPPSGQLPSDHCQGQSRTTSAPLVQKRTSAVPEICDLQYFCVIPGEEYPPAPQPLLNKNFLEKHYCFLILFEIQIFPYKQMLPRKNKQTNRKTPTSNQTLQIKKNLKICKTK